VLAGDGWHHGIIGIVASKISERYGLPTVLLCRDGDIARGSARSTPQLNIFEALTACSDLLDHFGGHALAAGLTLSAARVDELRTRLNELAWQAYGTEMPELELAIDAEVAPEELTLVETFLNRRHELADHIRIQTAATIAARVRRQLNVPANDIVGDETLLEEVAAEARGGWR
jgi:single-stranded-DNA-specific exonuclease